MGPMIDDRFLDAEESRSALMADARSGLTRVPKSLPPRWFYDERGSELFEQITELPEYYPTRIERAILAERAEQIAAYAPAETVIELGSGSSSKTRLLLDAWYAHGGLKQIVTVDVSRAALQDAAAQLAQRYPDTELRPVRADFTKNLVDLQVHGRAAVVFLGSTIGNLGPAQRRVFYGEVRTALGSNGYLVLGTDLVKSPDVLIPAYDDAAGVTAEFNLNVLRVLNRELAGDLPLDAFSHRAVWDAARERIEMRLRASREVAARLDAIGLDVHFAAGEEMLTEISCKFRPDGVARELAHAGLQLVRWWTDPDRAFAVSVSR
jgi:L-histidine N-alpha-methyltransferase